MTIKYLVKSPRVLFCKQRFHEKTNDIFADFILSKCAMMLEEAYDRYLSYLYPRRYGVIRILRCPSRLTALRVWDKRNGKCSWIFVINISK